jgi:hypothetical protein
VAHRLVEQLARRAHRGPDHLRKAVHVVAAFLRQAEHIGQHAEDVGLGDLAHGIDRLALPGAQLVDETPAPPLEHQPWSVRARGD